MQPLAKLLTLMSFALLLSATAWADACDVNLLGHNQTNGNFTLNGRPQALKRDVHHDLVLKLSLPSAEQPGKTLLTHLHMRAPVKMKKDSAGQLILTRDRSPYRTLHYSPETEDNMWRSLVRHTIGWAPYDAYFYQAVELAYGGRIPDAVKKAVEQMEREIPKDRTWLAMVYNEIKPGLQGDIEGTMRISNGTGAGVIGELTSSPLMPFERIFEILGVNSKVADELRALRMRDPNAAIYELGQLTLDPKLTADERRRALLLIELAFLDVVALRSPDAIYFTHVADEARRVLYQRTWGWTAAETLDVKYGEGDDVLNTRDHILTITGAKLKAAILKRLGLTDSSLQIDLNN